MTVVRANNTLWGTFFYEKENFVLALCLVVCEAYELANVISILDPGLEIKLNLPTAAARLEEGRDQLNYP